MIFFEKNVIFVALFYDTYVKKCHKMKKVKFHDILEDIQIIHNRSQIKEKERLYKYYLILYLFFIIISFLFFFYNNYPYAVLFIVFAVAIWILSNWENCLYILGFGIKSMDPYSLSIIPHEITDLFLSLM